MPTAHGSCIMILSTSGFAILDLLLVYVAELQDPKKTSKSIKSKKASDSFRIKLLKKSPAPSNLPPNPNLYRRY